MSNELDQQILARIAKGDSKAFESILLKYQDLVFGYSMKMLGNRQKAEDVTQETWIKVVKAAPQFKPTGSVKSWIMSITRNLVIDEFRAQKKWVDLDDQDWNAIEDPSSDLLGGITDLENNSKFYEAFDQLTEMQKLILSMVIVEELPQAQVAKKLNISVGAVKASLFRTRESLKKKAGSNE